MGQPELRGGLRNVLTTSCLEFGSKHTVQDFFSEETTFCVLPNTHIYTQVHPLSNFILAQNPAFNVPLVGRPASGC